MNRTSVVRRIAEERIIAILRLSDAVRVRDVVHALVEGGIRIIELTLTMPAALEAMSALAATLPPSVVLGAGSVLDDTTADAALDCGAQFIVSPICRPAMVEVCHRRDAAMMPGCLTPTEILSAWDAGADFVKLFPASSLAPSFVRDIHGPLPRVRLIPTGGIGTHNARQWLDAGASAVGVGGALVSPDAVAAGDFVALRTAAERLVSIVGAATAAAPAEKGGSR